MACTSWAHAVPLVRSTPVAKPNMRIMGPPDCGPALHLIEHARPPAARPVEKSRFRLADTMRYALTMRFAEAKVHAARDRMRRASPMRPSPCATHLPRTGPLAAP